MHLIDIATQLAISFAGSLAAVAFWFHNDIEDRWRLWKVKNGQKREERAVEQANTNLRKHRELIEEMRREDT